MKSIFKSSKFFYLAFLIGLLPFFGCGSDNETLSGEFIPTGGFRFPPGTSGPLWQLSDADIAEILESHSADWYLREHGEWRTKGRHGQFLKQFGDIPEVRYIIAYDRHPGQKTREQIIAKSEALHRLFRDEETLKALRQVYKLPDLTKPGRSEPEHEWIARDPEGYYKWQLESRIKRYGDIPEVYIVARFLLKHKQGAKLTGAEVRTYKAAMTHLRNLDAQREAKQDEGPDD
jgi:hypothetical protein